MADDKIDPFADEIEESGQEDSTKPPIYPGDPYEIGDEEMEALDRGGPATDDQFVEIDDPADPHPDDQDIRHINETATGQVADVELNEWEDRVAAEERDQELAAEDPTRPEDTVA